jgi:signal transduction histidine kinase
VDDGIGIGATDRRSGLKNLNVRAQRHGGSATVGPADPDASRPGTRVCWRVPLAGN